MTDKELWKKLEFKEHYNPEYKGKLLRAYLELPNGIKVVVLKPIIIPVYGQHSESNDDWLLFCLGWFREHAEHIDKTIIEKQFIYKQEVIDLIRELEKKEK